MYLHFVGKEVLTLSEKNGLGVRLSKCTAGCYTLCANTSFNTLYYIISLIVRIDYITMYYYRHIPSWLAIGTSMHAFTSTYM